LILITFAVGGSATGYVGKLLMGVFQIETVWIYIIIYILVVTIVWPLMVILVSIPFGQFNFFKGYLKRMSKRIFGAKKPPAPFSPISSVQNLAQQRTGGRIINIAIFASGAGTNAQKIIDHFRRHPSIKVSLIVSNKHAAGVLEIARKEKIATLVIEKEKFFSGNAYVDELKEFQIDLIVLAGFLWKLPSRLVSAWPRRIINIHPALLPKYGGKGLYGHYVHEAVIKAGEKESGITIHYVDDIYDHGDPIFQEKIVVEEGDTPQKLTKKVQALEHLHFPKVIEQVIQSTWK
jgi:formyltetrahydrofolate-dependent phosphoribosylglycinamide formyltransferase